MKRKGKPYNPVADAKPVERLVDRTAQDVPAEIAQHTGLVMVDGAVMTRHLRSDPLAQLHSRGHIDEAQFQAGRSFQQDWERAERGPRGIDPAKEFVDGGIAAEPISDGQLLAVDRLGRAQTKLGAEGIMLVQEVLIHGWTMGQVVERRGLSGRMWREYYGQRFRECLETLAVVYGHTNRFKKFERSVK